MIVFSSNEWSQLEEIIVGRATNALIPYADNSVRNFMYARMELQDIQKFVGPYDEKIINETNEDLEALCEKLLELKIKVHRPEIHNHHHQIKTTDWVTTGWANYCPRDVLLIVDDKIVEVPSPMRSRIFETHSYHKILYKAFENGAKWFSAPRPRILNKEFQFDDLNKPTLNDGEILFDAANIVRLGNTLLYQKSNSGNITGYNWLCSMFEEKNIILEEKAYSGAHMDSTIIPLREGLVLLNGNRVTEDRYPKIFKDWEKIFFEEIIDADSYENGISSNAIALNLLSINENLVILDEKQRPLINKLKKYKIESIPMRLRHSRTLGGGFHCATLDLKRKK